MANRSLSEREKLFCSYIARHMSPREAAARCGYLFPEKSGMKLISKKSICDYTKKIAKEKCEIDEVGDGLRRIIFGSIADVIKLMDKNDNEPIDAEGLDLFSVSELKFNKNGNIEVKFFDKIKALEKLAEISAADSSKGDAGFFEALKSSAESVWEEGEA